MTVPGEPFSPPAIQVAAPIVDLPKKIKRWLIIADLHIPFHDPQAVNIAIKYGLRTDCEGVLILGDLIDNYKCSSWPKNLNLVKWSTEIQQTQRLLVALTKRFPYVIWRFGNHENRLERWLWQNFPDMCELPQLSLANLCGAECVDVLVYDDRTTLRHKELFLLHGHEIRVGTHHVNPASYALRQSLECILIAHCHRPSAERLRRLSGTSLSAWSVGCLCSLHPHYCAIQPKWEHGFAILDIQQDWRVENKCIINGKVV